jgi:predicted ATP-dependent endonuclease of OLD family
MKIVNMSVKNYRQFKNAELNFDDGITILAGANNSGKTSLITLIKNVFTKEKAEYSESDIPAVNMQNWINMVYPLFKKFFNDKKTVESIEKDLVENIIPEDENLPRIAISTTELKIHISYDPAVDDIKLFADYIMDLDEMQHAFYFLYTYEVSRRKFVKGIIGEYNKIKHRFEEIEEDIKKLSKESTEQEKHNVELKERYLQQMIVGIYVKALIPVCYFCDKTFENRCKFDDVNDFRNLFHFCFIKASRPLDDEESDHAHLLSKQMIRMLKADEKWMGLIERLPDELLKPIQEKEIDKTVRETSLNSLKDTIEALEQTNGGQSGELMLDMQVTEEDISELLQRITTATYNVGGYYLGESSQGLGYSNLIYIHLQLKEYQRDINELKLNMFFVEEPESHMHPQMQQVFIKYLLDYKDGMQGLITTHSNEMVRVAGITHLRVIRKAGYFNSELYDPSAILAELKKSEELEDKELARFFDWFFEIGYSELIFADKAIFYEGDTERLYIRKLLTLEKYKKLKQQYIAYVQVGGAYAKNYEKLIRLLKIKSLIITDIDYGKDEVAIAKILKSETTNATITKFYRDKYISNPVTVENLYSWKGAKENIQDDDLINICFQAKEDGYARTLEEAMLSKFFSIDVSYEGTVKEWKKKRNDSKLDFSIPMKVNGVKLSEEDKITLRDILKASSSSKTNFMYSVIMNDCVATMEPDYIRGGLEWLMS